MSAYVEVTAPGSVEDPSEESAGTPSYHRITVRAGVPLTATLFASGLTPEASVVYSLRAGIYSLDPVEFLPFDDVSPTSPTYFNGGGFPVPWSPGVAPPFAGDGNSYFDDSTTDLSTTATFTPVIGPDGEGVYFLQLNASREFFPVDPYDVTAILRIEVLPARVAPLRQLQRDDRTRKGSSKQSTTRQGWKGTYL